MNAVEIEEAVSNLAGQPFDPEAFPYAFLEAFGNKETTIKRLRSGASNKSDLGGVLQTNNIHIAATAPGEVTKTLAALRASPATTKAKARFVLATDGTDFEAEDLETGEPIACAYTDFPDHFGFFLPLAGISTVKQISENAFDIRATSRLNKLYIELLKDNPEWGTEERRPDMNHFMARLIFCFFAEDTDIFQGSGLFTETIEKMSERNSSNTHEVVGALFRAMNTPKGDRASASLPRWANDLPYVNGGLFSGSMDVPRFSKIARSYLLRIGNLDWTKINPDIFGSMIQAVADDEERGSLGMHYTSVPNILKVLNPLFLDDLRTQLEEAGDNSRKLLNLRNRMSKIRVFDPACGSGNFLVIAYKEMRAIEAEINKRRDEAARPSDIPLTNFRGIELRDFPAEIARLALIIAEFQCNVLHRGKMAALDVFLPLKNENWITCGNALRLDWLSICPPTGTGVRLHAEDLFHTPFDQAQIDFENEGGETYICGNPPYQGSVNQTTQQKSDIETLFSKYIKSYKDVDYVACWFLKAAEYCQATPCDAAFVSTNSIAQGEQVPMLWPIVFQLGLSIFFSHSSFLWKNSAAKNAGVTCVIIGITKSPRKARILYGEQNARRVASISPYLIPGSQLVIEKRSVALSDLRPMVKGNQPTDGGALLLDERAKSEVEAEAPNAKRFIRRYVGSSDFIRGTARWCIWIEDELVSEAQDIPEIAKRIEAVRKLRTQSKGKQANDHAHAPHRFVYAPHRDTRNIIVPRHFSSRREYITVGLIDGFKNIVADSAAVIYEGTLVEIALLSSRLHYVWISTVSGRIKDDIRYSNTLSWNTFPVPTLTEKNKADLTRCAEEILLAREAHFPATIADLYDPENMPADLRDAHERNDEVLERIYIGRRFRNNTERLEKLFDLYTKMTAANPAKKRVGTV